MIAAQQLFEAVDILAAVVMFVLSCAILFPFAQRSADQHAMPETIRAFDRISKIEDLLYSKEPLDCALLGSSLVILSIYHMDVDFEGFSVGRNPADEARDKVTHCYSEHLRKMFRKYSQVCSLGVASATVADYRVILQSLLRFHKKPKLVIVCVGVRDCV